MLRPYSLGPDAYAAGQHRGVDVAGSSGEPFAPRRPEPCRSPVSFRAPAAPSRSRLGGYAVSLTHLGEVSVAQGATVAEGDAVGVAGPSGEAEWPTAVRPPRDQGLGCSRWLRRSGHASAAPRGRSSSARLPPSQPLRRPRCPPPRPAATPAAAAAPPARRPRSRPRLPIRPLRLRRRRDARSGGVRGNRPALCRARSRSTPVPTRCEPEIVVPATAVARASAPAAPSAADAATVGSTGARRAEGRRTPASARNGWACRRDGGVGASPDARSSSVPSRNAPPQPARSPRRRRP